MFRHADVVCLCRVHPVAVLNDAFCMTCSLLIRGCKRRPYGRGILQSQSRAFMICRGVCACTEML